MQKNCLNKCSLFWKKIVLFIYFYIGKYSFNLNTSSIHLLYYKSISFNNGISLDPVKDDKLGLTGLTLLLPMLIG